MRGLYTWEIIAARQVLGDTLAYDYRLTAAGAGDASNHETIVTQSTNTVVKGLINDVPYTFSVWARSRAGSSTRTEPNTSASTQVSTIFPMAAR